MSGSGEIGAEGPYFAKKKKYCNRCGHSDNVHPFGSCQDCNCDGFQ